MQAAMKWLPGYERGVQFDSRWSIPPTLSLSLNDVKDERKAGQRVVVQIDDPPTLSSSLALPTTRVHEDGVYPIMHVYLNVHLKGPVTCRGANHSSCRLLLSTLYARITKLGAGGNRRTGGARARAKKTKPKTAKVRGRRVTEKSTKRARTSSQSRAKKSGLAAPRQPTRARSTMSAHRRPRSTPTSFVWSPPSANAVNNYVPMALGNVQGPVSVAVLRSGPMTIWNFGDWHARFETPCFGSINIADLMPQMIQRFPAYLIDVFVEARFVTGSEQQPDYANYPKEKGYLFRDTFTRLGSCLRVQKRGCEFPNVRVHYVDVRHSSRLIQSWRDMSDVLEHWVFLPVDTAHETWNTSDWLEYLDEQVGFMRETNRKYGGGKNMDDFPLEMIVQQSKIMKQLAHIPNEALRTAVYNYILRDGFYGLHRFSLRDVEHVLQAMEVAGYPRRKSQVPRGVFAPLNHAAQLAIRELEQRFIPWYALLMDAYTMARMFRTYQNAPSAQHVIMYTGNAHASNYTRFLESIGFRKEFYTENSTQCLDLSRAPQPFFPQQ